MMGAYFAATFAAWTGSFVAGAVLALGATLLLGILLVDARKSDALTLWHLLSRVSDADRPGLYDRLAWLAPPPEGVTREGILRLDRQMLDAWWSSFGFGDIYLWRTYERDWSKRPPNTK